MNDSIIDLTTGFMTGALLVLGMFAYYVGNLPIS